MLGKEAGMQVHGWGGREVGGRRPEVWPGRQEPLGIETGETEVEAQDGGDIVYVGRASFRMAVADGGAVPAAQMARTGTEPHTGQAAPGANTEAFSLTPPPMGRTEDELPVSGEVDDIDLRALGLGRSWWASKRAAMAGAMTFALGLGIVLSAAWRSGPRQEKEALAVRTTVTEAQGPAATASSDSVRVQSAAPANDPAAAGSSAPMAATEGTPPVAPTPIVAAPAAPLPSDEEKNHDAPSTVQRTAPPPSGPVESAGSSVPVGAPSAARPAKVPARASAAAVKHQPTPPRPNAKAKAGSGPAASGGATVGAAAEGDAERWVDPWAN